MKRLLRAILLLGLLIAIPVLLLWGLARETPVEPGSLLVVEISGGYVESVEEPLLVRLLGPTERPFVSLLSELRKAERDERITAVVLRIRDLRIGWAKAQELRDAIASLSAAGKRTIAYLEVAAFGANLEYYVATAANGVHAAPGGLSPVVGLAAQYLFLGGAWEKLGIGLEVERIGDYKTAADTIAGREMSDAHREMANALLDSIDAQFVAGIAQGRDLSEEFVRNAIDSGPASSDELLALGLVDGVSHFDQVIAELGDPPVLESADYATVSAESVGFDPVATFALVYGSGSVVVGSDSSSPGGGPQLASDAVSKALEEAAEDDSIDAIILRIDSPGGSALASDIVWRATQKARESGKPLVASFSDVAASGGYYVAAGADFVLASPGTLTGSIGVFVLRPVLGELFEKLDVGVETLTRGAHAGLLLSARPLEPESRERLRRDVVSIYDLFVSRVAEGRRLAPEQVDEIGRGRVWTGAQAAEIGLVDGMGGLRDAVLRAKQELQLDPDADVALAPFPRARPLAEQLADLMRRVSIASSHPVAELARRLEPWWSAASAGAPVLLPPFSVEIR